MPSRDGFNQSMPPRLRPMPSRDGLIPSQCPLGSDHCHHGMASPCSQCPLGSDPYHHGMASPVNVPSAQTHTISLQTHAITGWLHQSMSPRLRPMPSRDGFTSQCPLGSDPCHHGMASPVNVPSAKTHAITGWLHQSMSPRLRPMPSRDGFTSQCPLGSDPCHHGMASPCSQCPLGSDPYHQGMASPVNVPSAQTLAITGWLHQSMSPRLRPLPSRDGFTMQSMSPRLRPIPSRDGFTSQCPLGSDPCHHGMASPVNVPSAQTLAITGWLHRDYCVFFASD